jgi:hypothetical protein
MRLRVERLEDRANPGVVRDIGTMQIVDMTAAPPYEWASGPANITGTVIGTDTL